MALKFSEKLKGIDLGKGKESLSEVASSVSKLFDRKNRESTISNVKENIDVEYELENILEPTTQNIVKEESEHILYQKVSQYVADNIDKFQQWYSDSQLDEKLTAVAKKVGATLIYPVSFRPAIAFKIAFSSKVVPVSSISSKGLSKSFSQTTSKPIGIKILLSSTNFF